MGALSIGVSYYAETEIVHRIPPSQFFPSPQVDSSVLKLEMRDTPQVTVENEVLFFSDYPGCVSVSAQNVTKRTLEKRRFYLC